MPLTGMEGCGFFLIYGLFNTINSPVELQTNELKWMWKEAP
jgi:hypothetical protein